MHEVLEADWAGGLCEGDFSCAGYWRVPFSFGCICILRHFVEDILRHVEPLNAQGFEIDFAACNAAGEDYALAALDYVHDDGGEKDNGEENGKDDDEKDPQAGNASLARDIHTDEETNGIAGVVELS